MGKSQDLLNKSTNWMSGTYDIMLIPWLLATCHNDGILHHTLAIESSAANGMCGSFVKMLIPFFFTVFLCGGLDKGYLRGYVAILDGRGYGS